MSKLTPASTSSVPTVWRNPWNVSPSPTFPSRSSLVIALMKVELKPLTVHGVPRLVQRLSPHYGPVHPEAGVRDQGEQGSKPPARSFRFCARCGPPGLRLSKRKHIAFPQTGEHSQSHGYPRTWCGASARTVRRSSSVQGRLALGASRGRLNASHSFHRIFPDNTVFFSKFAGD